MKKDVHITFAATEHGGCVEPEDSGQRERVRKVATAKCHLNQIAWAGSLFLLGDGQAGSPSRMIARPILQQESVNSDV